MVIDDLRTQDDASHRLCLDSDAEWRRVASSGTMETQVALAASGTPASGERAALHPAAGDPLLVIPLPNAQAKRSGADHAGRIRADGPPACQHPGITTAS
jgi:hypothetical protein